MARNSFLVLRRKALEGYGLSSTHMLFCSGKEASKNMRMLILLIAAVATASAQSALPADINPGSLNRLPVVERDQMDEKGKKVYDHIAGGEGKTAAPTGPASVELYSPGAAEPLRELNEYLRRQGNVLGNGITELAILVAAREGDSQYIWSAHEPAALKAGIPQAVIDVVKYNKEISGAGEKETIVIRAGRQVLRQHKLDSATFAKAVELFGRQGAVEMVTLMGDYVLNAMLLDLVDQRLPPERKPLLPQRP
jgi:4-carboxymuconolactone decarboxylase